jgi:hypothetical protein
MSNKEQFLTRTNINHIYNNICNTIENVKQIDLNQDPKYRKLVKKMMVMIYQNHNTNASTLQALNTFSMNKINNSMMSIIQNSGNLQPSKTPSSSSMRSDLNITSNQIEPMPLNVNEMMGSAFGTSELLSNMNQEQNNVSINVNTNTIPMQEQIFQSKLEEMERERSMLMKQMNVETAEAKQKDEIFSNAKTSDINEILSLMDDNSNQNLIGAPLANENALGEDFNMPGLDNSMNNQFETIQIELDDPGTQNLTPKAKANVTKKEEETKEETKEEFKNQSSLDSLREQTNLIEKFINTLTREDFSNENNTDEENKTNESSQRKGKGETVKTLVLDTGTAYKPLCDEGSTSLVNQTYWTNVSFTLSETLQFTNEAEVYLESLTINNPAIANNTNNMYFSFDFDFLDEDTYSNNEKLEKAFVIPNENTSGSGDNSIMKYHLKSNYLGVCSKTSIDKISVTIKNENGDQMQTSTPVRDDAFDGTNIVKTLASAVTGESGAINVTASWDANRVLVGESLFNKNGEKIGVVTGTSGTPDITFGDGTLIDLAAGDELYYAPGRKYGYISGNYPIGYANGTPQDGVSDRTLQDDNPGTLYGIQIQQGVTYVNSTNIVTEYPIGVKFYDKVGRVIGVVNGHSEYTGGGGNDGVLFFEEGIQNTLSSPEPLFSAPPSAVFNNNSKTNRLIMELIFREKGETLTTNM